ncbi:MAG: alpha-2-macroglobulin family protein [Acidobacteriota bacterium]
MVARLAGTVASVLIFLGAAVWLSPLASVAPSARPLAAMENEETMEKQDTGLRFRLSEGAESAAAPLVPVAAEVVRLSEAEVQLVLDRMPPLEGLPSEQKEFAIREKSLPPPRPGRTIAEQFPPSAVAEGPVAQVQLRPLKVERSEPEGEVPIAPHLSITFSHPMVAVTSHDELAKLAVPVRLTPEPPGKWRWIGTQTLLFEPKGRFPMATVYQAEVPAGTESAVGGKLSEAYRWTFSTPSPRMTTSHPVAGPVRRDALMFAAFDQRISPAEVLRSIRVKSGSESLSLRLATKEEVAADQSVSALAEGTGEGRWLAFRSEKLLPADSAVQVTVGPGTPSAEGPRKSAESQGYTFRTYGPMVVVDHRCGWDDKCRPMAPWLIRFSNPIDEKAFDKSMIRVDPPLPAMTAAVSWSELSIRGRSRGRTAYRVTLAGSIPDQFGQTLGKDVTLTFKVGPAEQTLWAQGNTIVVADPFGPPRYSVYTINHASLKVRIYAVQPEDWPRYIEYLRDADDERRAIEPPGRRVVSKTLDLSTVPDDLVETPIDLAPALSRGFGQVVLVVEPLKQPKERWRRQSVRIWIQVTQLALDAFSEGGSLTAWVTALKDGSPIRDAEVRLLPSRTAGRTDAGGTASLELPDEPCGLLVARRGDDAAMLPASTSMWGGGEWRRMHASDTVRWCVFDDRSMYRPGEEVRIKGWIRRMGMSKGGDIGAIDTSAIDLLYNVLDSQRNKIVDGRAKVGALGGFDFSIKLPATMNLGFATVEMSLYPEPPGAGGCSYGHGFQVQEFRRPEYEVNVKPSEGPYFVGGNADLSVTASYYAGGGLANAETTWRVTSSPGQFVPPNRDDYIFGFWTPWWESDSESRAADRTEQYTARTDPAGRHHLRIDFVSANPPRPSNVKAEATVMDVNRQAWSASTIMLVHPSDLYVGIKCDRVFVQRGDPMKIDSIVVDMDGKAVAGRRVDMRAVRLEWVQERGDWREKEVDPQDCVVVSAADAPTRCTFQTKEGGRYRISATVVDDKDRANRSEMTMWVAGGKLPPKRNVEQEKVTLIPDKKEYQAGDMAEILVITPFAPADGVLTLRRNGIFHTERLHMTGASQIVKVRIEDGYVPNLYVQVDLAGSAPRTRDDGTPDARLPARPAFAKGDIEISVPPRSRTLALKVTPRMNKLEPGGDTVVDAELRDADGKPVAGGEIALVVVDESVLSLTGYRLPNPLSIFYSDRDAGAEDTYFREQVLLSRPMGLLPESLGEGAEGGVAGGVTMAMEEAMPMPPPAAAPMARMAMPSAPGAAPPPIRVRTDFSALALFAPGLPTDSQGHASVPVKLPDSLTRYRIMAVAVAGTRQFGSGESTITARLPLMVRPSPPRFLNFGDKYELPLVVQNQTDGAVEVDVAVRAVNMRLTDGAGRRVTVPANDRVEVRLPAAAAMAGKARVQVGAVSGDWADAAEVAFPVWTPATTEAFATYGQIDEGAIALPVAAPRDVVKEFGGLEITTSSTALHALTDAVLYLVNYPFDCAEQLASRVIAVAALRDVLTAFAAEGLPAPEEIAKAVDRDIDRLRKLQNSDGGWGFWRRGDESWPYVSIHVAHALERAREKRFAVPPQMLESAHEYLKEIESHIPDNYPDEVRWTLTAYALYVRMRLGETDAPAARELLLKAGLDKLQMEAIGWLLPVLSGDPKSAAQVAEIRRFIGNRVVETAGAANFVVSYSDGAHLLLYSNRRVDGVLLEALIGDQPKSDLIPKLVAGLLAHRRAGRWNNTQENAFILLALDRYFNTYEKVTPDFVARAWLGETYAGEHAFKGYSADRSHIEIPMKYVAGEPSPVDLVLAKQGKGRLYYRIGMQYAPSSLKLDPADHGFTVERRYEAVDNPGDVKRDPQGVWHMKAGARVRVTLTMVAAARRYHVALVDPMPAGLEALNPALAVTGSMPQGPASDAATIGAGGLGGPGYAGKWWWWIRPWFDHQNMRDERVEAFASLLWEGVWTYSYVARATTPGDFVVPPTRAEEMYAPETFGRGSSDRVVVE